MTNTGSVAIAVLTYTVRFTEEGRTVPWGELLTSPLAVPEGPPWARIQGGIEPGESVEVRFDGAFLPDRADPARVKIEVTIIDAYDVDGEVIDGFDAATDAGPPMTAGELDAFRLAVQGCWNVGALPTDAAGTVVVVSFELTPEGRVAGDIRKVSDTGPSAQAADSAFEMARRAILRCQQDGFPLPPEKYGHWREVQMTFDGPRGIIR